MEMPDYVDWDDMGIPHATRVAWTHGCGLHVYAWSADLWNNPEIDWRARLAGRYDAIYTMFNGFRIESPIEEVMAGWLVWLDGQALGLPEPCYEPWFEPDYRFEPDQTAFSIQPQVQVGSYRVDFMVLVRGPKGIRRIAVECDGHDYHDRTKEQAARDKKRDRTLLIEGVQVMRFTGSEIWKDAMECFKHVQAAVDKAVSEVV